MPARLEAIKNSECGELLATVAGCSQERRLAVEKGENMINIDNLLRA
jgi:hypothetical protein